MQTTYRLKAKEISSTFLKSVKTLFAGEEVEITVRSVVPSAENFSKGRNRLLEMLKENRQGAPLISPDVSIRDFIDDSQCPHYPNELF
jgi:hypothetical protein